MVLNIVLPCRMMYNFVFAMNVSFSHQGHLSKSGLFVSQLTEQDRGINNGTEIGNSLEFDFVVPPPHS